MLPVTNYQLVTEGHTRDHRRLPNANATEQCPGTCKCYVDSPPWSGHILLVTFALSLLVFPLFLITFYWLEGCTVRHLAVLSQSVHLRLMKQPHTDSIRNPRSLFFCVYAWRRLSLTLRGCSACSSPWLCLALCLCSELMSLNREPVRLHSASSSHACMRQSQRVQPVVH